MEAFYTGLSEEVEKRRQAFEASGLRVREFCAGQPPALVLIDDGDTFIELTKTKAAEMEKLIQRAMELGVTIITTTLGTRMRGYDTLTKILKDAQAGVVLGNPGDQALLAVQPPRGYKAVQDIGFWFKRGDVRQVKLPFVG